MFLSYYNDSDENVSVKVNSAKIKALIWSTMIVTYRIIDIPFFYCAFFLGAKQRTKRVRDTQIDYENVEVPMNTEPRDSEPIPVEKLKWYTQSNSDLILRQYEVCSCRC